MIPLSSFLSVVIFFANIIFSICSFVIRIFYILLLKFRLMGVFLWCVGICIIYFNDDTKEKLGRYVPLYLLVGIFILFGTIIAIITAIIRIWKPGFQFLDLFTGAPEHMDIRYFQAVTSLEDLNSQYLHSTLQAELKGDRSMLRRMEREYEYLKRKFERNLEQV